MYMSVKHIKRFVQFKIKKIQSIKILFWDFFLFFHMHNNKFCPCNMQEVSE